MLACVDKSDILREELDRMIERCIPEGLSSPAIVDAAIRLERQLEGKK